jgi:hypothetical protein
MMIHAATFGAFGKQSDVISHASFVDRQVKALMHDIYKDFLTDSEFEEVIMGREIWLDSDEIIERLKKRTELQKLAQEKEKALLLAQEKASKAAKPAAKKSSKKS